MKTRLRREARERKDGEEVVGGSMGALLRKGGKFLRDESGTETVEWAVLAALLLIVASAAWTLLGGEVNEKVNAVIACLQDKTNCPS